MGSRRGITGSAQPATTTPSTVPVGSIAHNPRNPRADYDDVADLAASVAQVGVLQPLGVVRYETFLTHYPAHEQDIGTCDWVALNGNRRLAAAKKAGLNEVPVHVLDRLGRDDHMDESVLIENIHREALPPLREAEAIRRLVERHGSQRAAANRIAKTNGYVSQRLALLKLTPELQAAFVGGELRVEDARRIAKMSPEEQAAEWERLQAAVYVVNSGSDTGDEAQGVYDVNTADRTGRRSTTAKPPPRMRVESPEQVAQELRKHLDETQLNTLAQLLTG